jgi:hypothetical protein
VKRAIVIVVSVIVALAVASPVSFALKPGPPAAPTSLSATAASSSQINLKWTDNAVNESNYVVESSTDGTTFSTRKVLAAGIVSYSDSGLSPSTTYYYRVKATNSAGSSSYSNVAKATTNSAAVTTPAAPTNLSASAASSSQIDLKWTDNATNESSYAVERSTDGTTFSTRSSNLAPGIVIYSDGGLSPSTTYYYRVKATNSAGSSSYSNTANATTSSGPVGGGGSVALGTFPGNQYGNPAWDTNLQALKEYQNLTASTPKYVEVFHAFSGNGSFLGLPPAISTLVAGGYVPVITWEAQDYATGQIYTPHDIAAGTYDSYIRSYARQVGALGKEVDIRLFHELNGNWMLWSVGSSEASNQDVIDAFRHVHDIFNAEGATNAKFVFNPNERYTLWSDSHPYADYYPGDSYIDYLALDGYNWGSSNSLPWTSFDQLFAQSYQELTALSSTKPVMVAEYASHTSPGDKAQWITDTRNIVKSGKYPQIKALVWFESNQDGALWRVDTSQASLDAYKALAADPYFQPS